MDIDLVHARWVLGRFPADQIPEFAAQAMMQGFDGPNILELASFHRPLRHDIKPEVFDAAIREMGRQPLSRGEAGLVLARAAALKILKSQLLPEDGADEIREWITRAGYPEVPDALLRFQYGLYGVEEYHRRDSREYRSRVIELAKALI